jgi:hypothetical protein
MRTPSSQTIGWVITLPGAFWLVSGLLAIVADIAEARRIGLLIPSWSDLAVHGAYMLSGLCGCVAGLMLRRRPSSG